MIRIASGSTPSMERNKPPMNPGPRISRRSSLSADRYVAALNMRNPSAEITVLITDPELRLLPSIPP